MAIVIERTITVKNDTATLDNPLYLYVGDGDITFLFTIKEMKKAAFFGKIDTSNSLTDEKSHGEVRIYKPDGSEPVFTTRAEIIDDKLQALFTYDHIDQFTEAGIHQLQIHLYDDDDSERNRFTIPPIELNVLFPVGYSSSAVDYATVGYAMTRASEEPIDTFNEYGSYNKTEWVTGDKITSGKLNKIEDAIYEINDTYVTRQYVNDVIDNIELDGYVTEKELNAKGYITEHQSLDGYAQIGHTHDEYITNTELNAMNLISSATITRIEIVEELPGREEDGVLYIVKQ